MGNPYRLVVYFRQQLIILKETMTYTIIIVSVIALVIIYFMLRGGPNSSKPYQGNTKKLFHTKINGVTGKSKEGIPRQKLIQDDIYKGDYLLIKKDPDDGKYSVAVLTQDKQKLGNIAGTETLNMWRNLDRGHKYYAKVKEVTGGYGRKKNLGVNITVYKIIE